MANANVDLPVFSDQRGQSLKSLSTTQRLKQSFDGRSFALADLPTDLAEALRGFDIDNDGTVSMMELAEARQPLALLGGADAALNDDRARSFFARRRRRCVSFSHHLSSIITRHSSWMVQARTFVRITFLLIGLLLLQMGAMFGLIWAVVAAIVENYHVHACLALIIIT